MRWGLVPAWFKENDPGKMQYNTSNCRSENIMEKKSYKVCTNEKLLLSVNFVIMIIWCKSQCPLQSLPCKKDSVVSSWLMDFTSGGRRRTSDSPSSFTSLRRRRRKPRIMTTLRSKERFVLDSFAIT